MVNIALADILMLICNLLSWLTIACLEHLYSKTMSTLKTFILDHTI